MSGAYKLLPSDDLPQAADIGRFGTGQTPHSMWESGAALREEVVDARESVVDSLTLEPQVFARSQSVNIWSLTSQDFLESVAVQVGTIALILSNAIVIGLETDYPHAFPWSVVEDFFLLFFALELALRLYATGLVKFFECRNNPDITWNIFDFLIVSIGLVNLIFIFIAGETHALAQNALLFRMVRLLRILRVLRIIRIVRFLKQLYLLAYGFVEGTMAVVWVTILASVILYICSVILVRAYGQSTNVDDPAHEFFQQHFGTIPKTMFALFELISAPDLNPYKAVMFENPALVCFLVAFIIIGSFGINGLLVALINESILEKNQARIEAERLDREAKRKVMQQRCRELFDELDKNKNRVLPRAVLMKCTDRIAQLFESLGVNFQRNDLDQMFYILDFSDTGIIERSEFVQGVVELCDQIRPMSIMELHYQVSKIGSKLESLDNTRMEAVVKSVEANDRKIDVLAKSVEQCDKKIDLVMHAVQRIAAALDPACKQVSFVSSCAQDKEEEAGVRSRSPFSSTKLADSTVTACTPEEQHAKHPGENNDSRPRNGEEDISLLQDPARGEH
eukprot:TRINITY_DN76183_c0_g1_i1.p1 TRINITY_DN76183_c0_g1~~TRINITY_DN76183_c0_g1_i1.p1  ORF type:complete len:598 (-),score=102.84 TRINITY_DN76183_c0_g1_i1:80-1777(-)